MSAGLIDRQTCLFCAPGQISFQGSMALHMAAQKGRVGVTRHSSWQSWIQPAILLRAGSNPHAGVSTAIKRTTPLFTASAMVGGGGVGLRTVQNQPMHNLLRALLGSVHNWLLGHIDIVRALLGSGVDPRFDLTVADAAKAQNHPAIAALLEARLAELAAVGFAWTLASCWDSCEC